MAEHLHRLLERFDFERFLQHGDGAELENIVEHLTVRIAGDDHDRHARLDVLRLLVNLVAGRVGKLEIEETQLEFLFLHGRDRLLAGADDNAREALLLQEELEHLLETRVVVHHEHRGLAFLLLAENVAVHEILFHAPTPADLNCRKLPALHEIIHRRQRDSEILRSLLHRHQIMHVLRMLRP